MFALYHGVGKLTMITAWYLVPLFVVGVIFGVGAHRTGRTARFQVAHAAMSAMAFGALLVSL
ncbi:unannotated protein [freshwater metagenome]|uniref:Unannotated protein n=1 Tax=freshwater metagenome TaxID=449393 RepID=A0A6J7FUC1_9ZZZZ